MSLWPKHVIVATDFTNVSEAAARHAARVAEASDAALLVIYADRFIPPIDFVEMPASYFLDQSEQLRELVEQRMREYAAAHFPNIRYETKVVVDAPELAIVDEARAFDSALIVVGTHGRSGLRRVLLGSVSDTVIHQAHCPVLTVRCSDDEGGCAEFEGYRRIICPVNGSAVAATALERAADIADRFDSELTVLHVVEDARELDAQDTLERLRSWVPAGLRDRCRYRELVLGGNAAEKILDFAAETSADLLVIGAQHRRFRDATVIGTTTERVTRHASIPVLTVIGRETDGASVTPRPPAG